MKSKIRLVFLLLSVSTAVLAGPQKRSVVRDTVCNVPLREMLRVADRFCYQFQSCPDSLFSWAYVDLGSQKEEIEVKKEKDSPNAIQLRYKDRVYDPVNKTGDVAIDIYVLGVRWWKDQHLGTKYVLMRPAKAKFPLTAQMTATYSGSILDGGRFILRLEPQSPTRTRVHYEFNITFGKVLSTFISDKIWYNAIEWRLATILDNIVEYAEKGEVVSRPRGPQKK